MFQAYQPVLSPSWEWVYGLVGVICVCAITLPLYNVYLHPLSKFPGPPTWAMSRVPYGLNVLRGALPFKMAAMHEKYGPVIRVAPNQLSYIDDAAWNDIYGRQPGKAQLLKEIRRPPDPHTGAEGLFNSGNDSNHARMRRNFSKAFSDKSLRDQEPIMEYYFDLLIKRLREKCSKPIDVVEWYNYTTFDIVGDLLFGKSYECLEKSRLHNWVAYVFGQIRAIGIIQMLMGIPMVDKLFVLLLPSKANEKGVEPDDTVSARVNRRLASEDSRLDLMTDVKKHLNKPEGMSIEEIGMTAGAFIVAGSETSATLLSGATYLILKNPHVYQRLVNEIRTAFKTEDEIRVANIRVLKYQLAVLEESLRVFPPVPANLNRITPREGHTIAGRFIPGKTVVGVSQLSSFHSPSNFKRPDEFLPERWMGDPEFKDDNRKVFQPFSVGPRNCIGQNLAYAEMGVILARVLWNFDLELCEESRDWMSGLKAYTLWKKVPLMVKLTPVVRG